MSFLDSPCPAPPSSDQPPGMSIGLKYLIGISVSLTASCLSSLGVNIQAAALAAERERNKITAQQVHDALQHDDLHSELDLLEAIPEGGEEGGGDVGDDDGGVISSMSKTSKITINTTTTTTTTTNPASSSSNATAATGGNNVNLATFSSNQDISNNTTFSAPPSPVRGGGNNNNQHTPSSPSSSFFNWRLFLLRSQWYFGFIIYLVCQTFGSVISLAFIPPSVVAPLGATGLIFNILFSKLFLGTPITRQNWIGTFLVVIGCSIVSLIGSKTTPEAAATKPPSSGDGDCGGGSGGGGDGGRLDMKTIIRIFSTPLFIVYFTLLSAIVIALLVFAKYLEHGGPLRRYNERTAGGGGREASIVGDYSANASPLINGAGGLVQEPGSSSSAVVVAAAAAASTHLLLDSSLNSSSGGVTMGAMRFRSSSMSSSVTSPLLGSNNYSTTNDTIRFFESRRWRRFRRGLRRRLRKVNLSNLLGNLYSIMGGASASESLIFVRSGVDLLIQSIFGEKKEGEQSNIGFSILLLVLLLLTVILQLYGLNRGLSFSLPTVVIPLFFTVYTILSFANTLVFQSIVREVLDDIGGGSGGGSSGLLGPTGDFILVCLGLFMIVGGVWMLGEPVSPSKNHPDIGSRGERQPLLGPDTAISDGGVETDAFAIQEDSSTSAAAAAVISTSSLPGGRKRRSFPDNDDAI